MKTRIFTAALVLIALSSFVVTYAQGQFEILGATKVVASTLVRISVRPPTLLRVDQQPFDAERYRIFKQTQGAMVKTHLVLSAALQDKKIADTPLLENGTDKVGWLRRHVEVKLPVDTELMEIRLVGDKEDSKHLINIVNAVTQAYFGEVVNKERVNLSQTKTTLKKAYDGLMREIRKKEKAYLMQIRTLQTADSDHFKVEQEIALGELKVLSQQRVALEDQLFTVDMELELAKLQNDESGQLVYSTKRKLINKRIAQLEERTENLIAQIKSSGASSAALNVQKSELEQLRMFAQEMGEKIEVWNVNDSAPRRIQMLSAATVQLLEYDQ